MQLSRKKCVAAASFPEAPGDHEAVKEAGTPGRERRRKGPEPAVSRLQGRQQA